MRHLQWIKIVLAAMILLLINSCSPEERAKKEVAQLFNMAIPPGSACMSDPYVSGVGNNPRNCRSASLECVVGSALTRQEIQDYYTQQLGTGWVSTDTQDSDILSWRKSELVLDKMVVIEYEPDYLPADSKPGREFREARQNHTVAYVLMVMANKCTGPFP